MTRVLVVAALAATACSESSPPLASPSPPIPPVPVPPQNFTLTGTLLLTAPGGTRGLVGKLEVAINDTVNRRFERRLVETTPDGRYTVPDLSLGRSSTCASTSSWKDRQPIRSHARHGPGQHQVTFRFTQK